jgi:hypothetical protein
VIAQRARDLQHGPQLLATGTGNPPTVVHRPGDLVQVPPDRTNTATYVAEGIPRAVARSFSSSRSFGSNLT